MLGHLVRISIEGAFLAAVVWGACRALPQLSSGVRATLWWCVAAKFVVGLAWFSPIDLPILPGNPARAPIAAAVTADPLGTAAIPVDVMAGAAAASAGGSVPDVPWTAIVLGVWFAGVIVSGVRTLRAWRRLRGMVARSYPGTARLDAGVRELSRQMGLRRTAEARVSAEIESPLITGVRRPVILVPACFAHLSSDQQRMVLCHELAHLKRADLWLGWIPGIVERCFFFHPLARFAAREYAFWREVACDETVLATLGVSPRSYGRLLLDFGVSPHPTAIAAAGAAWSFQSLKRRIIMLDHRDSPTLRSRLLAGVALAAAFLAIAPVKAVARTARPSSDVVSGHAPLSSIMGGMATAGEAVTPLPGEVQVTQTPEPAASTPASVADTGRKTELGQRRQDDLNFVLFHGGGSTTMSGRSSDIARARRHQRNDEPLLWFSEDGRDYIVRDPALLREVAELWRPVGEIGAEQGKIGAQQGAIGARQGEFGRQQGEVGARQGAIGAAQGAIGARLAALSLREANGVSASERREIERQRDSLEIEMRELGRQMSELGREMNRFSAPMRELGEEMSALGREMQELGKAMDAASRRARAGMRELIDRAKRTGAAEVVG